MMNKEFSSDTIWNEYVSYVENNNEQKIYEHFEKLLPILVEERNFERYTSAYAYISNYFFDHGHTERILGYCVRLISEAKEIPELKEIHWYDMILASLEYYLNDYSASILHLKRAQEYYKKANDIRGIVRVIGNMAEIGILTGQYAEAINHLLDARSLLIKEDGNNISKMYNTSVLAKAYIYAGDLKKGKYYLDELSAVEEAEKLPTLLYEMYYGYGNYYAALKNWDKAVDYYKRTIDIIDENSMEADIESIYDKLSEIYNMTKDYENAYNYLLQASDCYKDYEDRWAKNLVHNYRLVRETLNHEEEIRNLRVKREKNINTYNGHFIGKTYNEFYRKLSAVERSNCYMSLLTIEELHEYDRQAKIETHNMLKNRILEIAQDINPQGMGLFIVSHDSFAFVSLGFTELEAKKAFWYLVNELENVVHTLFAAPVYKIKPNIDLLEMFTTYNQMLEVNHEY